MDRHWLEEYSGYYATMLRPPPSKATRLHFLRSEVADADLVRLVQRACEGDRAAVEGELRDAYLGFSVIRPLASAPVGRTVLRPYSDEPLRCFAADLLDHRVHLAGLRIEFAGLPFQQQDQGVGACATTAIWSALTKVMRTDGGRAPTPYAITAAATGFRVQARAFPAVEGLDLDQMATAIHAHGYQPHLFQPANAPDDFVLSLKTYLRSGIPVVVRANVEQAGTHALTFVGFREARELSDETDVRVALGGRVLVRSRGVVRWYVHDDRLGAYARLGFVRQDDGPIDHRRIQLMPTVSGFDEYEAQMVFLDALVPLYPKLRMTAEELVEYSLELRPPLRLLSGEDDLYVEPRFLLEGQYLRELEARRIEGARYVRVATTLLMSRYVGVLSWFVGDDWICDALYDTTDVRRDTKTRPPILALIPKDPGWIASLENFREVRFGSGPLIA